MRSQSILTAALMVAFVTSGALAQGGATTVTVGILSPTDGASYAPGSPIMFSYMWSTNDPSPNPTVTCLLDGAPSPTCGEIRTDLAVGQHTYSVEVQVGGLSAADSATITVTPAVSVSILTPADGAAFAYGDPVAFDYEVTTADPLAVPVVDTLLDGMPGPAKGATLSNLVPGQHAYAVTAMVGTDVATDSVTFNILNSIGKVTGGGWILGPTRCTFGLVVTNQGKRPKLKGNLLFQDHDMLLRVKSRSVTGLGIAGNTAVILGTCTINGEPGHTFSLALTDAGKLKKKNVKGDTFAIALDTGYQAYGTLGGGNIVVHKTK